MKYAEQIRTWESKRKAAIERQEAINALALGEDRSLDADEAKEFDQLETDIEGIDQQVGRLKKLEAREAGSAAPAAPAARPAPTRGPTIIIAGKDMDEQFKGQGFTRRAIARALAHIDPDHRSPGQIAEERWGKSSPTLVEVIKAGVAGGTGITGNWAANLVQADTRYTGDFIELLYAATIFDQLNLRVVPANVVIKGQDTGATANWVGEGKGIPVSAQDFTTVSLGYLKVAAISVVTKELLKHSDPAAEMLVRDALVQACAQKVDTTFLGSAAAVANVSPAGILNGLLALGSNGVTDTALRQDIGELVAPFITAKIDTRGLVLVMHPSLALSASLMATSLGIASFPNITANGGSLLGIRVVTGHNIGANTVALIDPTNVWRIGDAGIEVSMSDQATIEQDTAPAGVTGTPTAASATLISLWGQDSVGFKIVRPINFQKRRTAAVSCMTDCAWGEAGGSST